jgi:precorrin-6Y C5,15-methyltransferase (decarboxylating)
VHRLDAAWAHLVAGGRIVAHAVTLGAEAVLVEAYGRLGGELTRITVEHVHPLGRHLSWTPARPVVQWSATKPSEPAGRDTNPPPTEGT